MKDITVSGYKYNGIITVREYDGYGHIRNDIVLSSDEAIKLAQDLLMAVRVIE